ncbi:DUF6735 family protein [Halorussus amylolyticus]|uniref:DUF6735 family protein n=1 Tax=Halorussus amylolyticus TaxID=1126242 RepID=UPI00104CB505|nr:DUF6735 family protein [Halorussus amylolyticus]
MGHRALIAYERPDRLYNLHYSHWGALNLRLRQKITERTPFGDEIESEWSQHYYRELLGAQSTPEEIETGIVEDRPHCDVDPAPVALRVTIDDILSTYLDFLHHEALYVVSREFEVYRTLWFGLQYDCETVKGASTVGNGALCTRRWFRGEPVSDGFIRGQFEGLKDVVGDLIDDGVYTPEEATEYMVEKLSEWSGDELEYLVRLLS